MPLIPQPASLAKAAPNPVREAMRPGELHWNQFWETAGTLVKVAFFFLVTPLLVGRQGATAFGEFALGISAMACVFSFDLGIRNQLRVVLSPLGVQVDAERHGRLFAQGIASYLVLFGAILSICVAIGLLGGWSRMLGSGDRVDLLMVSSIVGSELLLLSIILLEPLAARERLSETKGATFLGNLVAIPAVLTLVWLRQPAWLLVMAYLMSQVLPNAWLAWRKLRPECFAMMHHLSRVRWSEMLNFAAAGRWIGVLNVQWLMKSYLLTFLIGILMGSTEAGLFFLLLKFSELLSLFATTSAETALAALASRQTAQDRQYSFRAMYAFTLAMLLPGFATLVCLLPWVLEHFMKISAGWPTAGLWVGLFGMAVGFKRILTLVCMGTALSHYAVLWGVVESALTAVGIFALYPRFGMAGVLATGAAATVALCPVAIRFARSLQTSSFQLWIRPALGFFLSVGLLAWSGPRLAFWPLVLGLVVSAIVSTLSLRAAGRVS